MTPYERQIALEIEMAGLGVERFQASWKKNIENERGASTDTGSFLVKRAIRPLSEAITSFVDEVYAGKAKTKAVAAKLTKDMDHNAVAYLVARAVFNRLMSKNAAALTSLARVVASAIEDEARFTLFAQENKEKFKLHEDRLQKDGATEQHKRTVLAYAMGKYDIPWDRWTQNEKILLGSKMIELFCETTGLAEIVMAYESSDKDARHDQYLVQITEKTAKWVEASAFKGESLSPFMMPMVIQPKPWSSLSGGGYFSSVLRPLPLVKRARPEHRALLAKADLTRVYEGLNAIQNTAWKINRPVLEVMEQMIVNKTGEAGLIVMDDIKVRPRPEFDDPTTEENKKKLQEWRWEAREAHNANYLAKMARKTQADLMQLVDKFKDEERIYFPHNLDFRGRAYPVPVLLHPQGPDTVKGLLHFAEGLPLGAEGERWLAIHGANCFGVDKVSFDERVQWVLDNELKIAQTAADPLGYKWWTEADSPWCFLAFCLEWDQRDTPGFVSHIPVALDGSCNGLQHFSAMLRDPIGGAAVNLLDADKPQDIYQRVADVTAAKLRQIASTLAIDVGTEEEIAASHARRRWSEGWGHFGLNRKITKRPVMVLPYGGTPRSCLKYVQEAVGERIKGGQDHNFGDELGKATGFLSTTVWDSIGNVVVAARQAMDWLQEVSKVVSGANRPLMWKTPSGFIAYQDIRDIRSRRVSTKLAGTIVQLKVPDETDKINKVKQATSVSPNFVHSLDAAALFLTVFLLANRGMTSFAMIHDSYGTHACNASRLSNALRYQFMSMYQKDILAGFLDMLDTDDLDLPPMPPKGTLDIKEVLYSKYFFA